MLRTIFPFLFAIVYQCCNCSNELFVDVVTGDSKQTKKSDRG